MQNKKKELLKPKYDVVFQALFGENKENITQSFVSDIIGEKIEIIDIKSESSLTRKYPTDKGGRLDLKTKFKDGTICQIEMQLSNERNIINRMLYYWAKTFISQLKRGESFQELVRTIGIVIIDFEIKEIEGMEKPYSKWQIMETEEEKRILTNKLELYILEIPKARRIIEKETNNKIAQWLMFLDNPNTERVEEIMKENEDVKKANTVLHEMSEDEELKELAELLEKWEREEISLKRQWKEDGLEEGRKEGRKEGIEKGKSEKTIEIAKKMKAKKINMDSIIEITGLAKEEIEKL